MTFSFTAVYRCNFFHFFFFFFFSHFQELIKTSELKTARVNAIPLITIARILMHFSV